MNISELIVQCLENENVEFIFGVPGEENEELLLALEDSDIQFIPTRHEQGAAFVANVTGRLTRKAGVCLSTLGPGATNLVTGLADAQLDGAPVVAITAQGSTERMHHESHQMLDVKKLFDPITKWSGTIHNAEIVSEVVKKAVTLAEEEKPGVTHIEVPENIASLEANINTQCHSEIDGGMTAISNQLGDTILDLIGKAERPLILAGNGIFRAGASDLLRTFVDNTNIPVVNTFMAKGVLGADHDCHIGTVGLGFRDYVMEAFEDTDLVITIGYDIIEYEPTHWNPKGELDIIHINQNSPEIYDEYIAKLQVIGPIKGILHSLIGNYQLPDKKNSWYKSIQQRVSNSIDKYGKKTKAINVPGVVKCVRDLLPHDGIVLSDVGSHKMWIARNLQVYEPNTCIISNGFASMGIAIPGLIGANVVFPDRKIVAMMGDGGALMNFQELETAVRTGCKGVVIVFKDDEYGLIKWKQKLNNNEPTGTSFGKTDFVSLAESFGIEAHSISSYDELDKYLDLGLKDNKLTLLEVPISNDVNDKLVKELESFYKKK